MAAHHAVLLAGDLARDGRSLERLGIAPQEAVRHVRWQVGGPAEPPARVVYEDAVDDQRRVRTLVAHVDLNDGVVVGDLLAEDSAGVNPRNQDGLGRHVAADSQLGLELSPVVRGPVERPPVARVPSLLRE